MIYNLVYTKVRVLKTESLDYLVNTESFDDAFKMFVFLESNKAFIQHYYLASDPNVIDVTPNDYESNSKLWSKE